MEVNHRWVLRTPIKGSRYFLASSASVHLFPGPKRLTNELPDDGSDLKFRKKLRRAR